MAPTGRIQLPNEALARLCRRHHIRWLAVFGSVLRDDFAERSDVDMLVDFEAGHAPGLAFFGIQEELTDLLGRRVDLNTANDLRPDLREEILRSAEAVFGPA